MCMVRTRTRACHHISSICNHLHCLLKLECAARGDGERRARLRRWNRAVLPPNKDSELPKRESRNDDKYASDASARGHFVAHRHRRS